MYTSLYMLQLTLQCCMNEDCSTFLQPVFHFSTVQQVAGGGGGCFACASFLCNWFHNCNHSVFSWETRISCACTCNRPRTQRSGGRYFGVKRIGVTVRNPRKLS